MFLIMPQASFRFSHTGLAATTYVSVNVEVARSYNKKFMTICDCKGKHNAKNVYAVAIIAVHCQCCAPAGF